MFGKLALRELIVLIVCLGLWQLDAALRAQGGGIAIAVALVTALSTVLAGFLAHEWGHLGGAWLTRSAVAPGGLFSPFVFYFDTERNTARQFVGMSLGGFVTSCVVVALVFALVPLRTLAGQLALGVVLLGVVATLILEVPAAWKVAHGAPLPRGPERPA